MHILMTRTNEHNILKSSWTSSVALVNFYITLNELCHIFILQFNNFQVLKG